MYVLSVICGQHTQITVRNPQHAVSSTHIATRLQYI